MGSPRLSTVAGQGRLARTGPLAVVIGLTATVIYGSRIGPERNFFMDEESFIVQAAYADLLAAGDLDHQAWLDFPAIDQPPLEKYLVGFALRAADHRRRTPNELRAWLLEALGERSFREAHQRVARDLVPARWPSVLLGALGCVGLFALGSLIRDGRTGVVAAGLLLVNPLYDQQARRALADVPSEALLIWAAVVALWSWRRILDGRLRPWAWIATALAAGSLAGLSVLAKLSALTILIVVACWVLLALGLARFPARRRIRFAAWSLAFAVVAGATFIAGNPTLTASPNPPYLRELEPMARRSIPARFMALIRHRAGVSEAQQATYPHYALTDPGDKIQTVLIQGFGRFSPFGPRTPNIAILRDWIQDRWAVIWLPWVLLGGIWAAREGRRQLQMGIAPTAWAALVQSLVTLTLVTAYLPLAWDRYLLPIQPMSSLLAAGVVVAGFDLLKQRFRRTDLPRRATTVSWTLPARPGGDHRLRNISEKALAPSFGGL